MALSKQEKQEIIERFAQNEGDTGSVEVQVALLTRRIRQLTEHFGTHKQDFHSQRGLQKMVGRRRRLLQYLKDREPRRYSRLIRELGIRGV